MSTVNILFSAALFGFVVYWLIGALVTGISESLHFWDWPVFLYYKIRGRGEFGTD